MILGGCSKKLYDLTMSKSPYLGNELKIDGYYYSNQTLANDVGVVVFYRDGFCINTWVKPTTNDTLEYIENEILLNDAFINKIKGIPAHIGVFKVINPDIEFETWETRTTSFSRYGKIINDSTFIINKSINNATGVSTSEKLTYRFKHFSPKPDSTNNYIK